MKKLLNRKKGFTLIELMIVVAIIGILAAIAIPNFLRFQLKAKSSEGKTNLAAIRTAEQSYYSEFGSYISADPDPAVGNVGASKTAFQGTTGFGIIGWSPEGTVYFSYAVDGDGLNTDIQNNPHTGFTATAYGDIDADTTPQGWMYSKADTGNADNVNAAHTSCPAAAPDHDGDGNPDRDQVIPCAATHGQSVF